jgi:hypothetical protein
MKLAVEYMMVIGLSAGPIALLVIIGLLWKMPRKLKVDRFRTDWKELQKFCRDKATWSQALIDADNLLDKALKLRRFKGKRMGERLVSAQRKLTNNDSIWAAHNLTKKVLDVPNTKLTEAKVRAALVAYRQALIDIGALPNGQSKKS